MGILPLTVSARVGSYGVLALRLPLGLDRAEKDVRVRIEPYAVTNPYSPFGTKDE